MASIFRQLVVLTVLAGGAAWAIQSRMGEGAEAPPAARAPQAAGVMVEPARAGRVERVVSAVGTGRALRSVELQFSAGGRIAEVLFRDGDAVSKGDALARLDDAAERAALAEAEAAYQEARAAFSRADTLREQGRVAGSTFDASEAELLRTEARLARARSDLDDRTLRAPFDGVVGFSDVDPGAVVTAATVIATIDDISKLDVQFSIPERFFGEVEAGDAVRARTRIFPDELFEGEVEAIDRRVDEVSRAFRVRAQFDNAGLRLPAGAFMQVELVLEAREGVLAPEEALVTEAGRMHLFVVGPDDRIERRDVVVGSRRAGDAEILEGLEAGERVVTRGVQKARDGAPARILDGAGLGAPATGAEATPGTSRASVERPSAG